MNEESKALQDGMLTYYLSVAGQQDANVEARIEREAFFLAPMLVNKPIVTEKIVPTRYIYQGKGLPLPFDWTEINRRLADETSGDNDLAVPPYLYGLQL